MTKWDKIKDEVAVVVGVLVSLALLVQDQIANGNVSWRSLTPIVAAAAIRRFTWGPKTVEKIQTNAEHGDRLLKEAIDWIRAVQEAVEKQQAAEAAPEPAADQTKAQDAA